MVVYYALKVVAGVVSALFSVIPAVPVPSWLSDTSGPVGKVFAFADSLSVWFPVQLALTVLAAYLAIKATAFGIRVVRMVISVFTGGGGSAG